VQMPAGVDFVTMSYLDQGHIGTLTDAAGVVWKYYYDADGKRRIKVKTAGGAATEPDGQGGVRLVADRSYYFYEGENLICQQDIGTLVQDESQYEPKFLLLDHLGSTRAELVFTESGGVFSPVIQEYYDLMPYGEVIDPPSVQESVLFTNKLRDRESGSDYFGFRYLNAFRWTSPDPLSDSAIIEDPQSWNRYSYVSNNPLMIVDLTGLMGTGHGVIIADEFGYEKWIETSTPGIIQPNNATIDINVPTRIILDANSNNGKGLTEEQEKRFLQYFNHAIKTFKEMGIAFDVEIVEGLMTTTGGKLNVTNAKEDALNICVTSTAWNTNTQGGTGFIGKRLETVFINTSQSDSKDLMTHELLHVFLHHNRIPKLPLFFGLMQNLWLDFIVDYDVPVRKYLFPYPSIIRNKAKEFK